MKLIRYSFLALILAFSLTSCDIVEGDKVCTECLIEGAGKKVIIEDFTGHQCGNCPDAHKKLDEFKELYGDNLIVISIHAGGFATVFPALGYMEDYTCELGDALENHYQADIEGLPIGMVNRRTWPDGNVLQKFGSWGTQIGVILNETPGLGIEIEAALSTTGNELEVEVELEYYGSGNASHQLVVVLTEDNIISKQSDYSNVADGYIADYEHKHMLRGAVTNGDWGEVIKNAEIFVGETFTKNYTYTLDPTWDPNHLHIVAYVLDNTTKEILQAEEIKM